MKFVIKDHLEMVPDILSVIEKMTKDEGIVLRLLAYYLYLKSDLGFWTPKTSFEQGGGFYYSKLYNVSKTLKYTSFYM